MLELLFAEKCGKWIGTLLDLDHGKMEGIDYGALCADFAAEACVKSADSVSMVSLYPAYSLRSVFWSESLGMRGANFVIYQLPINAETDVEYLKRLLRKNRDVSSLRVIKIQKLIDFSWSKKHE